MLGKAGDQALRRIPGGEETVQQECGYFEILLLPRRCSSQHSGASGWNALLAKARVPRRYGEDRLPDYFAATTCFTESYCGLFHRSP